MVAKTNPLKLAAIALIIWLLVALVVGFLWHQSTGILGAALGWVTTSLFLGCSWVLVRGIGQSYAHVRLSVGQMMLIMFALLLKFPIIFLGWEGVKKLGPTGPTSFLVGLASVYCALITWAVLAARDQ